MSLSAMLVDYAVRFIAAIGLPGVAALAALEILFAPIPGEVVMAFAGFLVHAGAFGFVEAVLAGTVGNLVGSLAAYWLGATLGRALLLRWGKYMMISEKDLEAAEEFFRRRGVAAVLLGRLVPGIRSVISFPAGLARMNLATFTLLTILGSAPWNAVFVYAGVLLGERWEEVLAYSEYLDAIGVAVLVIAVVYVAVKLVKRRR